MKKIIVIFLDIILAFSLLMPTSIKASAEQVMSDITLDFVLSNEENQSVVAAQPGHIINVYFTMKRTDSLEDYTVNTWQNFIHYDTAFFEFVEGSIVCNDTGMATALKDVNLSYGDIIQCQNIFQTYTSDFVFCSFQLKVIGTSGSGMVYNDEAMAFEITTGNIIAVSVQNLEVIITDCVHAVKINVDAKAPDCDGDGWEAYSYCENCNKIFDESGKNLLAGVPVLAGGHNFTTEYMFDENGHWYECMVCGEKSSDGAHNGGTATCKEKATCAVCAQAYGEIDANHHVAETYNKNKKTTLPWQDGYTGDLYCADCQQMTEAGKAISQLNVFAWPLWILVAIPVLLFVFIAMLLALFNKS